MLDLCFGLGIFWIQLGVVTQIFKYFNICFQKDSKNNSRVFLNWSYKHMKDKIAYRNFSKKLWNSTIKVNQIVDEG